MPRFDIDQEQLAEPIVIVIDGKEYTVEKITTDLMVKVSEFSKNKEDINAPIKQLALLLGVSFDELKGIDLRKIAKALKRITDNITSSFEEKNPSGAGAKE